MKHYIRTSALVLITTAFLAGCAKEVATTPAARPAPTVTVAKIKLESVTLKRELPGRATPFLIAEVRPQVSGIIKERLFEEGAHVEAGQALYQLDDAMYQANHKVAKATLENAQAALKLARSEAKRSDELFKAKAVSAQEFDNSQTALQQAEAQANLAAASLASSEITLNYSRITSPISGLIGKSNVTKGALVTGNQATALATVQQLDPIYIDISQASSEMLSLRRALAKGALKAADQSVEIILEDGTTYEHPGKISFSDITVDPSTGSFTLRVVVPNPDHLILPGMYAQGVINEGIRENGILVPQKAVSRNFDGTTSVKVVTAEDTIETRQVTLGQTIGNRWIINSGLEAGERVVTNGLQKATPGAKVQVSGVESSQD